MDVQQVITAAEAIANARKCIIEIDDVAPVYVPDGYAIEELKEFYKIAVQTFENGSVIRLVMLPF